MQSSHLMHTKEQAENEFYDSMSLVMGLQAIFLIMMLMLLRIRYKRFQEEEDYQKGQQLIFQHSMTIRNSSDICSSGVLKKSVQRGKIIDFSDDEDEPVESVDLKQEIHSINETTKRAITLT